MVEEITVVTQSQLSCRHEKQMNERLEGDLATLTKYGRKLRNKNIANQISEVVPELSVRQNKKQTPQCGVLSGSYYLWRVDARREFWVSQCVRTYNHSAVVVNKSLMVIFALKDSLSGLSVDCNLQLKFSD